MRFGANGFVTTGEGGLGAISTWSFGKQCLDFGRFIVSIGAGLNGELTRAVVGRRAQEVEVSAAFGPHPHLGMVVLAKHDLGWSPVIVSTVFNQWSDFAVEEIWEHGPGDLSHNGERGASAGVKGGGALHVNVPKGTVTREFAEKYLKCGVRQSDAKHEPAAPHESWIVVDATTGTNALQQAKEFQEPAALNGVIVTKLDGSGRGGVVVAIQKELNLPARFIGTGEKIDQFEPFNRDDFVSKLL